MVTHICLPALLVALASFAAFFTAMEPQYRRTFYARDSRATCYRRAWEQAGRRPAQADADRASLIVAPYAYVRYVGDEACSWIEQHVAEWERSPPEWYMAEWRAVVRERVHFLGADGPRVVRMRRPDDDGDEAMEA